MGCRQETRGKAVQRTTPVTFFPFPGGEGGFLPFSDFHAHSYRTQGTPPDPRKEGRRPPSPPARECADTPWTPPGVWFSARNSPFFRGCPFGALRATRARNLVPGIRVPSPPFCLLFPHKTAFRCTPGPFSRLHPTRPTFTTFPYKPHFAVRWCLFTSKACKCLSRARTRQKRPPTAVECGLKSDFCTGKKRLLYRFFCGKKRLLYR